MVQQVYWNVTVNCTSPLFEYKQSVDSGSAELPGWQTGFTEGIVLDGKGTSWGFGTGFRVTNSNDTVVKLRFEGTSAWLFGFAEGMAYNVTIDKRPVKLSSTYGVLASVTGLDYGNHTLVLRTTDASEPESRLMLQKAIFSVPSGIVGGKLNRQTFDNLDEDITYNGWSIDPMPKPDIPSDIDTTAVQSVHLSTVEGDWASFRFTGRAVWVDGITNDTHGLYDVSIDQGQYSKRLSGRTKQIDTDALLYYQGGLDPTREHTITIRNVENKPLVLRGIRTLSVEGGEAVGEKPLLPLPAIIGIAVGAAVIFIAVIVIGTFLLLRRRSRGTRVRHAKSHKLDLNQDMEKGLGSLDLGSDRRRGSDATLSPFIVGRTRSAETGSAERRQVLLPPVPAPSELAPPRPPPTLALDTRSLPSQHSQPTSAFVSNSPESRTRMTPVHGTPLQTTPPQPLPPVRVHVGRSSVEKGDLDWHHGPGALLASFSRAEVEVMSAGAEGPPPEYCPRDR